MLYLYWLVESLQYWVSHILIVLLMQLREIKVKRGSRMVFLVNEYGELIPQKGSQFSCLELKASNEPSSPMRRVLLDIQEEGWKLQANSNRTTLNSTSCRCKKSRCLKYYCDCFAEGRECGKQCDCTGCQNTPAARQANTDAKKVSLLEKGCFCAKSNCLKNYCVCHAAGRKCSPICQCKTCKNGGQEKEEMREENQSPGESRELSMRLLEYPFPPREFSQWECSSPYRKNESS